MDKERDKERMSNSFSCGSWLDLGQFNKNEKSKSECVEQLSVTA